ncbi:hypothetical protein JJJ17_19105 [Paracoccus caeni]|uniref:Uncharacterized protein n=1 Tax=Paracoccus caeni TaxID=657651 RepID=A0A934W0F7_9RHOB|nr:hypothetical protein [Paracoccus caeni]MBK4218042.1 hypothetical protein [Paracoccus caeni]
MRLTLILMMMVAFVTMTVSTAGQSFAGSTCSSQLQVADMCYAVAVPAAQADPAQKAGSSCIDLTLPQNAVVPIEVAARPLSFAIQRISSAVSQPLVPLPPPRAA